MNILQAIKDPKLFAPCFKDIATWTSWLTLLKALFGLWMSAEESTLLAKCTGRPPGGEPAAKEAGGVHGHARGHNRNNGFRELWAICGRRSGKSFISALIACYLALFYDYKKYLNPGEVGVIQIIASDRAQSQVILNYIKGILRGNPIFSQLISNELRESVELSNNISIETASCSYRAIRGRTVVCALCDEMSFWRSEGSSPDKEILAALRPSMATIPNSKLIIISSPYSQWGEVYQTYKNYFAKDDPNILVWKAPTAVMNPTISRDLIKSETLKDPSAARSEWEAEFREDLELFLSREAVEACCVLPGNLAPRGQYGYRAFCDPSGGKADEFSLAVGHQEKKVLVVDLLKSWEPPFNPEKVVSEISEILGQYRIGVISGDRYSGEWVVSAFSKFDIRYCPAEKPKSELYLNFEPFVNTQMVQLPRNQALINQLISLERRKGKAGKDSVDHPRHEGDDLSNAVAGLSYTAMIGENLLFPILRVEEARHNVSAH